MSYQEDYVNECNRLWEISRQRGDAELVATAADELVKLRQRLVEDEGGFRGAALIIANKDERVDQLHTELRRLQDLVEAYRRTPAFGVVEPIVAAGMTVRPKFPVEGWHKAGPGDRM